VIPIPKVVFVYRKRAEQETNGRAMPRGVRMDTLRRSVSFDLAARRKPRKSKSRAGPISSFFRSVFATTDDLAAVRVVGGKLRRLYAENTRSPGRHTRAGNVSVTREYDRRTDRRWTKRSVPRAPVRRRFGTHERFVSYERRTRLRGKPRTRTRRSGRRTIRPIEKCPDVPPVAPR